MIRKSAAIALLLLALPAACFAAEEEAAETTKWIEIWECGRLVRYPVPEEFEFYVVERQDIRIENRNLMREICKDPCEVPGSAKLGWAVAEESNVNADHYAARPDGPFVSGLQWRDQKTSGSWDELRGAWFNEDNHRIEFDHSSKEWNFDLDYFARGGLHYGIEASENLAFEQRTAGRKDRQQLSAVQRFGTMDGGSWNLRFDHYDVETDGTRRSLPDVQADRVELEGRMVEGSSVVEGAVFAGKYESDAQQMDNNFTGVRLEAGWDRESFSADADARVTAISPGLQDGSVTRTDFGGSLSWDLGADWTLTGHTRGYRSEDTVAGNGQLKGYTDVGARLGYRASGSSLSGGWRRREVDAQRFRFEDGGAFAFIDPFTDPAPRADLLPFLEDSSARSDLYDIKARVKLSDCWYAGLTYTDEQFDELPPFGSLSEAEPQAALFPDERRSTSLHTSYDLNCLGNVTLRADCDERRNTARGSEYKLDRLSLDYTAPIDGSARWMLGVTRQTTDITGVGDDGFDADSWNYAISLSGDLDCTDYRLSYNREDASGYSGGDYDSLGLELSFDTLPLYVSAWWRERRDALGGFADYDDSGVAVGYRVNLD